MPFVSTERKNVSAELLALYSGEGKSHVMLVEAF